MSANFFYDVYFLLADEGIVLRGTAAIKKFHGSIGRMLDEKER